jgi:hypothetical protein
LAAGGKGVAAQEEQKMVSKGGSNLLYSKRERTGGCWYVMCLGEEAEVVQTTFERPVCLAKTLELRSRVSMTAAGERSG